jgi:hypothetical protein
VSNENLVWFVCRSQNDGPFSKRVCRLEAPSILTWFQWRIDEARIASKPSEVGESELGGAVEEMSRLFQAVQTDALRTPRTMTALRKMLREHLWDDVDSEAAKNRVQADGNTLRILPMGASSTLLFLEKEAAVQHPEFVSFLLHEESALPDGESQDSFNTRFEVPVAEVVSEDPVATYVCAMAVSERQAPGLVRKLSGVDLPRLLTLLRAETPANLDDWPEELRSLRTKVQEEDQSLAPALQRVAEDLVVEAAEHDGAKSLVLETDHTAVLCAYISPSLGYRQLILFDDRWAAAHPELATSLIRYAHSWDPFAQLKAPPAPKAERKVAKRAAAPKKARPSKAALQAEAKQEASWTEGLAGRTGEDAQVYSPRGRFEEGAHIQHARFGLGFVSHVELNKCTVVFEHSTRLLVHGMA